MFTQAIVRVPGRNFDQGLSTGQLGVPRFEQVLLQHARYCDALRECGLNITTLEPDLEHADSTFVEDTAVLTARSAILARPGARSREGEVTAMRPTLRSFFADTRRLRRQARWMVVIFARLGSISFLGFRNGRMKRVRGSLLHTWLRWDSRLRWSMCGG